MRLIALALCVGALVPSMVVVAAGADSAQHRRARSALPLLTYVAPNGGVCLIRADGSHPVRLTPRWKGVEYPSWSPRGRYLAFGGWTRVVVVDARGRIRWRFGASRYSTFPTWSPDGRRIVYHASWGTSVSLQVAAFDGSDNTTVAISQSFPSYAPGHPAWTPDGQQLAFQDGGFFGAPAPEGIYIFTIHGSEPARMLIANAYAPAFSPDGSKLAYVACADPWRSDGVFIADANGENRRRLMPPASQVSWGPAWSPDGTRLAFGRATALAGGTSRFEVVVVRTDGSGERVLASSLPPVGLGSPVWSPGGKYVAFVRGASGAIVVARADGSGKKVVVARSNGNPPVWRAAVALPTARRAPCPRR